jgi:Ca2+-binding RTX toxin-like protein
MTAARRLATIALTAALAFCGSLATAAGAFGSFDLMRISEVHPDTSGDNDFIELQMYASGQNQVAGGYVAVYNAGAYYDSSPHLLPSSVPNGESQRSILISNSFADLSTAKDFVFAGLTIPNQGSVCFLSSLGANIMDESDDVGIDCVSFGQGFANPPSPVGNAAPMPGPGESLHRSIAPGCGLQLDPGDDTDDSATDFSLGAPSPRNNATKPTEIPCVPCPTGATLATIVGTAGPDVLNGTPNPDRIAGLGGNDLLRGLGGADVLCGGGGNDRLLGGRGRDRLLGQAGRDLLRGGPGRDVLRGGPGRDTQIQ